MTTDEDNFDIDVYGDGGEEYAQEDIGLAEVEAEAAPVIPQTDGPTDAVQSTKSPPPTGGQEEALMVPEHDEEMNVTQTSGHKISSTNDSTTDLFHLPKQAPQTQGVQRKEGDIDNRYVDPSATTALFVSDLHWWISDDDVRGWANQAQCEDELEDITFNEHKVNGKSKGQAYVLFKSTQAATAAKSKIQSFGEGQQYAKKFAVSFSSPHNNPFRTLPKDGPMRSTASQNASRGGAVQPNNYNSTYRGRGTGYGNRGGSVNAFGRGGYHGGAHGSGTANLGQMGHMPTYGGFQGRGGMMGGMRGGGMNMRGGRGAMMGMPMNMGMGGLNMNMGMPGIGAMGMGGTQGTFNPAFFGQQQGGFGYDNPHPAKRTRQD